MGIFCEKSRTKVLIFCEDKSDLYKERIQRASKKMMETKRIATFWNEPFGWNLKNLILNMEKLAMYRTKVWENKDGVELLEKEITILDNCILWSKKL